MWQLYFSNIAIDFNKFVLVVWMHFLKTPISARIRSYNYSGRCTSPFKKIISSSFYLKKFFWRLLFENTSAYVVKNIRAKKTLHFYAIPMFASMGSIILYNYFQIIIFVSNTYWKHCKMSSWNICKSSIILLQRLIFEQRGTKNMCPQRPAA